MRKLAIVATVVVSAGMWMLPGLAAEQTITGLLVEAGCGSHLGDAQPSEEHVACMVRCANNGDPIGILTDDGLYTITGDWAANNPEALAELMAEQVNATGETSNQGGRLQIEVSAIVPAQ